MRSGPTITPQVPHLVDGGKKKESMEKPLWEGSIVFRLDKGDAQRLIENVRLSCGALEEESSKKITTSVLQADPYNWTRTSWSE
ncbi:hypothetical protein TNIN_361811 [Trichonephila inaurata madagascariensis]|uniref:Uncharacterized protein n=1 Tax=Trichonephila inaurata madagascariensis TaxID=2747483 RepID=A0A8X6YUM0_9ARAC|nr:hypothetical protein TNIN_361811 [Trichonephila inaurata madagascariensis]